MSTNVITSRKKQWGIFVATYSSIFICSPMLIYLGLRNEEGDRLAARPEASAHDAPVSAQALLETETAEPAKRPAAARKPAGRNNNRPKRS